VFGCVLPPLVPIPSLDRHIVAASQNDARGGVYSGTPNIVQVGLKGSDLFVGIVVEDTELEVGASDEPFLPRDEI